MDEKSMFYQIPVDTFTGLMELGAVYVDKTGLLGDLVNSYGPYFLARPRRFGKSLLLDTIQQIFEGRRELFAGLDIERKAGDFSWKNFPVIRINMNTVEVEPVDFQADLISKLKLFADSYGVKIKQTKIAGAISDLIMKISIKYTVPKNETDRRVNIGAKNVVLLIDEYDFPILKNLRDPTKIEQMRSMLYGFYSSIKGCSNFLRFVFITGITKFKQLSLFSALNNVMDISFDEEFSTICGFTKDEIQSNFGMYLGEALSEQVSEGKLPSDSTVDRLMDKITEWYDGYSWDGTTKVFNPYSIKSFLYKKKFDDYWYQSGTSLFTEALGSLDGNRFEIFGNNISVRAPLEIQDTGNINDEAFLLQAGYLTIDSIVEIGDSKKFNLKIPDHEIRNAINGELSSKFQQFVMSLQFMENSSDPLKSLTSMKGELLSTLWSCDTEKAEMLLSSIFSGNPREWYRGGGEGSFKLILLTLMRFGGAIFSGNMLEALGEVYSDAGRSDLLFDVAGKGYIVIELKYIEAVDKTGLDGRHKRKPKQTIQRHSGPSPEEKRPVSFTGFYRLLELGTVSDQIKRILDNKVDDAFNQILTNDYAKQYLVSGKQVRAVAVAVYDTSTVMVRFAEVVWKDDEKGQLDFM
ncbi:MAG: AAA family ATPase [Deltaproteobacteria bacterium]|nr:AAA family ATPase [Deltaproteobacteria bacterium]